VARRLLQITVFEYDTISIGQHFNGIEFCQYHFDALAKFYQEENDQFFTLGYKRIQFREYVGVIQVGQLLIEILPKADLDKKIEVQTEVWRKRLVDMLHVTGFFNISAPTSTSLKLRHNSLLDLYFELFVKELENLMRRGLTKTYRKTEGNLTTLKGSLLFSKHLQNNLIHQERFYTKYSTYDIFHPFHYILYKTLLLLKAINHNPVLRSRICGLLLNFPEMPDIKVEEPTFDKLVFNRKNEHYRKALAIARLLLLNYHPDISSGRNHVLALMFDMNLLWEEFILVTLRNNLSRGNKLTVSGQVSKSFWKPEAGRKIPIRPDIVISTSPGKHYVLDTKWKNLNGINPSISDLRQMFTYHHYYYAEKVAIIYPGKNEVRKGLYILPDGDEGVQECSLIGMVPMGNIKMWQQQICERVDDWIRFNTQMSTDISGV
jgi:5-methylcytosine-specific restriction enzyme subunit McrC